MDYTGKLIKISEKTGGILKLEIDNVLDVRRCVVSWMQDGYKAPEQWQVLGGSSDPREAVDTAFRAVCPPIPNEVEGWTWDPRTDK